MIHEQKTAFRSVISQNVDGITEAEAIAISIVRGGHPSEACISQGEGKTADDMSGYPPVSNLNPASRAKGACMLLSRCLPVVTPSPVALA